MDEPTAALGPAKTAQVGEAIKQLKAEGVGIFRIEAAKERALKMQPICNIGCTQEQLLHRQEGITVANKRPARARMISPMIGSSLSARASQQPFVLRQTRLTLSLPTAPPNSAASALRTPCVLAPERYAPAIKASARFVRRW